MMRTLALHKFLPPALHTVYGCGPAGPGGAKLATAVADSNPYSTFPPFVGGALLLLLITGGIAIWLGRRARLSRLGRHIVLWPLVAATIVALLGLAWTWQVSTSYNDAGCLVYYNSWPVDEASAGAVASFLILGTFALAVLYLALDGALLVRTLVGLRNRR